MLRNAPAHMRNDVLMLAIGCVLEAAWQITRGTNAMT